MYIKIKNKGQYNLLCKVNSYMGKIKLPNEVLLRINDMLKNKDLGKHGYIAIMIPPLKHDVADVLEYLDIEDKYITIPDDNFVPIYVKGKKHPMKKKRKWNSYYINMNEMKSKIYVIYSMSYYTLKELGEFDYGN